MHFEVRLHPRVVVKEPRQIGPAECVAAMVAIHDSLSDIEGVPWVAYDEPTGLVIEERAPGQNMRRLGSKVGKDERRHIKARELEVLEAIRDRGYVLRDRTPANTMFDPQTWTVTVIDFVEIFRLGEEIQAWRQQ